MEDIEKAVDIEEAVYEAIRKVKDVEPAFRLAPETSLEQIGLSSLEFIMAVYQVEERFSVSVADSSLAHLRTIADVRDMVLALLNQKAGLAGQR